MYSRDVREVCGFSDEAIDWPFAFMEDPGGRVDRHYFGMTEHGRGKGHLELRGSSGTYDCQSREHAFHSIVVLIVHV